MYLATHTAYSNNKCGPKVYFILLQFPSDAGRRLTKTAPTLTLLLTAAKWDQEQEEEVAPPRFARAGTVCAR